MDTNILPPGLVERVEVLTGGAATAYGSDAMSGVTNITLRNAVEGFEFDAGFERTDRNDGDIATVSALGGGELGPGRGHITGFASYLDSEAIYRADREISKPVLCEDIAEGELYRCGSPRVPGGYQPTPAIVGGTLVKDGFGFDTSGNPIAFTRPDDLFNYHAEQGLRAGFRRSAVGAALELRRGEDTRLDAVLLWSQHEVQQTFAPAPVDFTPLIVSLSNPYLNAAAVETLRTNFDPLDTGYAAFPYHYRLMALGNREEVSVRDNTWLNLELSGSWLDDWLWRVGYTLTDFKAKTRQHGGYSDTRLQQALAVDSATGNCLDTTGRCSPADIFGAGRLSVEAVEFIRREAFVSRENSRQQVVSLATNGTLGSGAQRELAIAAGLEWREDQARYQPDPELTGTVYQGFPRESPVRGANRVGELYTEMLLTLARDRIWAEALEVEFGARYSDYSNVDEVWTWKSGMSWIPVAGLRLRGMYQRATRAPNVLENYSPTIEDVTTVLGVTVIDPCAASRRPQDVPGRVERCIAQGADPDALATYEPSAISTQSIVNSGNPGLDRESADTYTVGLVWTPGDLEGFSLTLDAYRIDIDGAITYVPPEPMFQLCFVSVNPGLYCSGIERSPGGDVTRKFSTYLNIGAIQTGGFDLSLSYLYPHRAPWGWGSEFGLSLVANRTESFKVIGEDGDSFDCAGKFGGPCTVGHRGPLPKHSALTRLHYRSGPLTGTVSWRWLDGTSLKTPLFIPAGYTVIYPVSSVGSEQYLDFNLAWGWSAQGTLSFSVLNLTDTEPPRLGSWSTSANTDPGTYDVLGRRYQLAVTLRL